MNTIHSSNPTTLRLIRDISNIGSLAISFENLSYQIGTLYVDYISGDMLYDNNKNGKTYKVNMTQI